MEIVLNRNVFEKSLVNPVFAGERNRSSTREQFIKIIPKNVEKLNGQDVVVKKTGIYIVLAVLVILFMKKR